MVRAFEGLCVAIIGVPERVPTARLVRELEQRRANVTRRVAKQTQIAVIAHGAIGRLNTGRLETIVARAAGTAEIVSEHGILRELGLLEPPSVSARAYDLDRLLNLSGLAPKEHLWLELFDIFEPVDGRYDFRDLILARQITTLLRRGITIPEIVTATIAFRRRAAFQAFGQIGNLTRTPAGEIVVRVGEWLADLVGQYQLPLEAPRLPVPGELYDLAERAADMEDWSGAERIYRMCADIDPHDALAWYNCANVVRRQGRTAEAAALLRIALELDPLLADAWYNLAHLDQDRQDNESAIRHLEMALACDERYVDAVFNLAVLRLRRGEHRQALELFERYVKSDPASKWGEAARTAIAMCRMRLLAEARNG